jgi:hypothetical protein
MTTAEILMVVFTAAIAVTGVLGAIIFNNQLSAMQGQLDQMKTASKIAETAARATKEAADTSREALVKSQRAFVRSIGFPWLWRADFGRPGKYFYDITPVIENAGATPTVHMKIVVDYAIRETPLPDQFNFPYRTGPADTLVGPRQTIGANHAEILDDDLLAIQNGTKFFYLWGTITYLDVFDGTPLHTTEFCTQITRVLGNPLDPRDLAVGPKATSVEITFGIHREHNRTD